MRKKFVAIIIFICLLACMLSSCSERAEPVVTSILIKQNSFKLSYEIDENLNYDNIFILVTYDSGEAEFVQCDNSMVKGFNTLTTGERQLYIEFGGARSDEVSYEVLYSIDNSKQILTSARLEYTTFINNEILSYTLDYYAGDLTNCQAILFDLYSEDELNVNDDLSNVSFEVPTGWSYSSKLLSTKNMRVLFFNKDNNEGISSNTLFRINVNKGNAFSYVRLRDIEVSTLDTTASKYYLPDFVR
jgi:hypothetical protein